MTEPFVGQLYARFADAGMDGVVQRLSKLFRREHADLSSVRACTAWVFGDFEVAAARCDDTLRPHAARDAAALADALLAAIARVGARPASTAKTARTSPRRAAGIIRLYHGELFEALAAARASELCAPADHFSMAHKEELAQLFFDSSLVATWTSAHAEFLLCTDEMAEISEEDMMVPNPDLHFATSAFTMADLVSLYEKSNAPKSAPKAAQPTLSLLTRLTNPGSRGWDSSLQTALVDEAATRICLHAVNVALSGLHPCIHPAARLPWQTRAVVSSTCKAAGTPLLKELCTHTPACVKDAMRVHLSMMLGCDVATLHALASCGHTAGQLGAPPRVPPLAALQTAMHAFTDAAAAALADRATPLAATVAAVLSPPSATKKNAQSKRRFPAHDLGEASVLLRCREALIVPVPSSPTALGVTASLLSATFRSEFLPLWVHGQHHSHRVARLDNAQYRALHEDNTAHVLCAQLPVAERLRAQRFAFALPHASLLTVEDTFALLGLAPSEHDEAAPAPNASVSRAQRDAEARVLRLDAADAAAFFEFGRASALRAQLLSFDLGARTRRMQARAVCERMLITLAPGETPEAAMARAPAHATRVFVCTECRRVVNACQDGTLKKQVPFNELGLSASMLHVDGALDCGHIRCAKRSSAALRAALALEEVAEALCVEELPVGSAAPSDLRQSSLAAALPRADVTKVRRDTKNCLEQRDRAVSCGSLPLVKVDVFGRAVRVYGSFYALCSLCGALTKLSPTLRFSSEPCCMRCDYAMLKGKQALEREVEAAPKPPVPSCRFCGRSQAVSAVSKWRVIHAPLDNSGPNAHVPPPLRTVSYCPLHSRTWLPSAHRSMPIEAILSHILTRAKPMIGAGGKDPKEMADPVVRKPKMKAVSNRITKRISANKRRKSLDRV